MYSTVEHGTRARLASAIAALMIGLGASSVEADNAEALSLLDETSLTPIVAPEPDPLYNTEPEQASLPAVKPSYTHVEHTLAAGASVELAADALARAIDVWQQERSSLDEFDLWHVVDVRVDDMEFNPPAGDAVGLTRVSVAGLYFERRWDYRPDESIMHVDFRLSSAPIHAAVKASVDALAPAHEPELAAALTRMRGLTRLSLSPPAVHVATID